MAATQDKKEPSNIFSIMLNKANAVSGLSNQWKVPLLSGLDLSGWTVGVGFLSLPYSWYNFSSTYGNNSFSYTWGNMQQTPVTVTIPNSLMSISDLNTYLQSIMIANNDYLIDQYGNQKFYISIAVNPVRYAIQVNLTEFPTTLPTGWTYPGGTYTYNAAYAYPQFIVPAAGYNTSFSNCIGFLPGTYPSAPTIPSGDTGIQSFLSTFAPQVSPVTSLQMLCSVANNTTVTSNVFSIFSFSPVSVSSGQYYSVPIQFINYYPCQSGVATDITITLVDQLNRAIQNADTDIVCVLTFRRAHKT